MSQVKTITVDARDDGMRLDRWLRTLAPGLGQGQLQKLLRTGQVRVDGKRAKANHRLEAGAVVRVPPLPEPNERPAPKKVSIDPRDKDLLPSLVVYQDDWVIVIDKPAGLAVQGGAGTHRHVDGLLDTLQFDRDERPRLVHRIDKDTSGLLALARDRATARDLTASFKTRNTKKLYWALTVGVPDMLQGQIDAPLFKSRVGSGGQEKMVVDAQRGDHALTDFRVIDHASDKLAWIALQPLTGRTHQLRAHLQAVGAPILGDGKYGGREAHVDIDGVSGQMHLHAHRLLIPRKGRKDIDCRAPMPKMFKLAIRAVGLGDGDGLASDFLDTEQYV